VKNLERRTREYAFPEISHVKKRAFLAAIATTGRITVACKEAGIDWKSHYYWLKHDQSYVEAFHRAMDIAADGFEEEVFRRAFKGYQEELSYKGRKTGQTVKKFSDVLAIFALKGLRPHKYRENLQANLTVNVPVAVQIIVPAAVQGTNSDRSEHPESLPDKKAIPPTPGAAVGDET
jgi:hypothetical protein